MSSTAMSAALATDPPSRDWRAARLPSGAWRVLDYHLNELADVQILGDRVECTCRWTFGAVCPHATVAARYELAHRQRLRARAA